MIRNIASMKPDIRFPEYSSNWVKHQLGSLGGFINGLTYSPNDVANKGLLVLRSSNIQLEELVFEDNVFVSLDVKNEHKAQQGDILICVRNGSKRLIGKNATITAECPEATHGAFMTMFRGTENRFIYQLFQTQQYQKQIYVDLGATINSINGSNLKKYKFFLPDDAKEKDKIADFLSAIDKKISLLKQKHSLLQQYKKGVMQQLFSQQIRFKDDNGKAFPDWEEDRVDSFIQRVSEAVNVEIDTIYREIGIRSHGKGVFHKNPILGKELGNKRVFWVHTNAFIVNIVFAWEHAVALTTEKEQGFIASHRFPMYVPKNNRVDISFFLLFFLSKRGKYLLELASPGGAGRNKTLGQNNFSELTVTFPCLEEQKKIRAFAQALDEKIGLAAKQIELTQTFKKGLLQQMFV